MNTCLHAAALVEHGVAVNVRGDRHRSAGVGERAPATSGFMPFADTEPTSCSSAPASKSPGAATRLARLNGLSKLAAENIDELRVRHSLSRKQARRVVASVAI
jgi:hypothetical protein